MNVIEKVQETLSASRCFYSFSLLPPLLATRMNGHKFWTFCSNFVKAQEKIFPDLENCEFITGTTKWHILRSVHLSHNKL